MAQLSRPYQIALVTLLLAALAWLALGMHHSPSSGSSQSSSSSQPATTHASSQAPNPNLAAEEAKQAAKPTPIYHGSAPGVEGLSRAVRKAHEAVATSQANANTLAEKSAQASGEKAASSAGAAAATTTSSSRSAAATTSSTASKHATRTPSAPAKAAVKRSAAEEALVPAGQRAVEATLAAGKVPVVLFWNPQGADDIAVHEQLQRITRSRLPVEIFEGNGEAVASYGALTRDIPVYGTPTILIVAKNGQTTELTGLQERFSIEQAIDEARKPST